MRAVLARAALAASVLVCVIAQSVRADTKALVSGHPIAVLGVDCKEARLVKGVAIFDAGPYEETPPLVQHIFDVLRLNHKTYVHMSIDAGSNDRCGPISKIFRENKRFAALVLNLNTYPSSNIIGGRLPGIANCNAGKQAALLSRLLRLDGTGVNTQIGPQLPFGVSISAAYQSSGSEPKHPSNKNQQPLAGFNTKDFRSVLLSLGLLWGASALYWRGWHIAASALAAIAIFGLLLTDW